MKSLHVTGSSPISNSTLIPASDLFRRPLPDALTTLTTRTFVNGMLRKLARFSIILSPKNWSTVREGIPKDTIIDLTVLTSIFCGPRIMSVSSPLSLSKKLVPVPFVI